MRLNYVFVIFEKYAKLINIKAKTFNAYISQMALVNLIKFAVWPILPGGQLRIVQKWCVL